MISDPDARPQHANERNYFRLPAEGAAEKLRFFEGMVISFTILVNSVVFYYTCVSAPMNDLDTGIYIGAFILTG